MKKNKKLKTGFTAQNIDNICKVSKKEVLLIAYTHGNEPIGMLVVKELLKNKILAEKFNYVIGNPRALEKKVRFIDVDLNRSAPGKKNSKLYEEQRAYDLVRLFKDYKYVIDFHSTTANNRTVIIIPRLDIYSLALALAFDIDEILIWPPSNMKSKIGPLMQYKDYGIEIEVGIKNYNKSILDNLVKVVSKFLLTKILKTDINYKNLECKLDNKKVYLVGEKILLGEIKNISLKDHKPVLINGEIFTPLLFGKHKGLLGYKMKPIGKNFIMDFIKKV